LVWTAPTIAPKCLDWNESVFLEELLVFIKLVAAVCGRGLAMQISNIDIMTAPYNIITEQQLVLLTASSPKLSINPLRCSTSESRSRDVIVYINNTSSSRINL